MNKVKPIYSLTAEDVSHMDEIQLRQSVLRLLADNQNLRDQLNQEVSSRKKMQARLEKSENSVQLRKLESENQTLQRVGAEATKAAQKMKTLNQDLYNRLRAESKNNTKQLELLEKTKQSRDELEQQLKRMQQRLADTQHGYQVTIQQLSKALQADIFNAMKQAKSSNVSSVTASAAAAASSSEKSPLKSDVEGALNKSKQVAELYDTIGKAYDDLVNQKQKLVQENESLRAELAGLDPKFFEEIEDLKYEHAQLTNRLERLSEESPSSQRDGNTSTAAAQDATHLQPQPQPQPYTPTHPSSATAPTDQRSPLRASTHSNSSGGFNLNSPVPATVSQPMLDFGDTSAPVRVSSTQLPRSPTYSSDFSDRSGSTLRGVYSKYEQALSAHLNAHHQSLSSATSPAAATATTATAASPQEQHPSPSTSTSSTTISITTESRITRS